ncbi:hypothetical protein L9F63_008072, partial [Diploptera punctata]
EDNRNSSLATGKTMGVGINLGAVTNQQSDPENHVFFRNVLAILLNLRCVERGVMSSSGEFSAGSR